MLDEQNIKENLSFLHKQITDISGKRNLTISRIKLITVTKTQSIERIRLAYDCGERFFGENRIQELATKVPCLPNDCEWHLIGHLQKNKVRQAVRLVDWIDSVDSLDLLERIERIAGEEGKCVKILIQVNVSGEESKFGIGENLVGKMIEKALCCDNVSCLGLMTIAPHFEQESNLRGIFARLRMLRDKMMVTYNIDLPELSMGMSGDYALAIEEGATMIRVGSAIFGQRT